MIYLRIAQNGKKLSMPLVAINFRELYAIVKDNSQFYLYRIQQQKLVPLTETTAAVYLTKHIIPPPQL